MENADQIYGDKNYWMNYIGIAKRGDDLTRGIFQRPERFNQLLTDDLQTVAYALFAPRLQPEGAKFVIASLIPIIEARALTDTHAAVVAKDISNTTKLFVDGDNEARIHLLQRLEGRGVFLTDADRRALQPVDIELLLAKPTTSVAVGGCVANETRLKSSTAPVKLG